MLHRKLARTAALLGTVALLAGAPTAALADCVAGSAAATPPDATTDMAESTAGQIAKDGSHTPLETPADAAGVTDTAEGTTTAFDATGEQPAADGATGAIAKDGTTAPLAEAPGDTAGVATSGQDVAAQQQGDQTAQQQATQDGAAAATPKAEPCP